MGKPIKLPRLFPRVGDKKWDGGLYTEQDVSLAKAGFVNMASAFMDLGRMLKKRKPNGNNGDK